ncbi:hypothetical protein JHK86_006489 [Glycine max]|nr:hypothetical protein JHK86_006489 [Glycine max]
MVYEVHGLTFGLLVNPKNEKLWVDMVSQTGRLASSPSNQPHDVRELLGLNFQVREQISLHQGVAVCQQGHWSHCEETRPPYPANFFPYGHYYPPIPVSPMDQFLKHNGFPLQSSTGNMYLPAGAGIKFPVPQLKAAANTATQNFTNTLGEGSFGTIYKAMMPTREVVAVKMPGPNSKQGDKNFQIEVVPPVVHRDLKYANILLDHSIRAKNHFLVLSVCICHPGNLSLPWVVQYYFHFNKPIRPLLVASGYCHSGNADGSVPGIGTRYYIEALGLPLKSRWRTWYYDNQNALTTCRGTTRMHCVMDYIPATAIETGGMIRFNIRVGYVGMLDYGVCSNDLKWVVRSVDKKSEKTVEEVFNEVVIATGHYSQPRLPSIQGK